MSPSQALRLTRRVRRGFAIAATVKTLLVLAAIGAAFGLWGAVFPGAGPRIDTFVLMGAAGAYVGLAVAGGAGIRLIHAAAAYTALGRMDLAERVLVNAAMGFSLYRGQRLLAVQNLAWLAHGAGRFTQAALLSRFVVEHLGRSRRLLGAFDHPNRLLLADSELMLGRLGEAQVQLTAMDGSGLTLTERLAMLATTCYYEVSASKWDRLADEAPARAPMAALMPPAQAATTLACLALGCQHVDRLGRRDWLWQEATLLMDREELVSRMPLLGSLDQEKAARPPWRQDVIDESSGEST